MRTLAVLLACAAALAGSAHGTTLDEVRQKGTLRVAVYRDYPPYSWREGGNLIGTDVDMATALAARLGVKVDFMEQTAGEAEQDDLRNAVWKGHYLGGGVADVMLHVPVDPHLAQQNPQVLIAAPYAREGYTLAWRKGAAVAVATLPDLSGKVVGVEAGSLPDLYLSGAMGGQLRETMVRLKSTRDVAEALAAGKVDLVMALRGELEHAEPDGFEEKSVPLAGLPNPAWPIGNAVVESAKDLSDALGAATRDLIADGTVRNIYEKYHLTYEAP
jgi:ABC-type amino acid transport substrate-binding protein